MNEIYVPFLLIMMGWHDGLPVDDMKLSSELHISQQVCEQAGTERENLLLENRADRLERFKVPMIKSERFTYRCVESPRFIQKYNALRSGE
jgi:hypothetical protein